MAYAVIKGSYQILGREPDGDSIAFSADRREAWNLLPWKSAAERDKAIKRNAVQLRIEAIDALETHYEGRHQPMAIAKAATHHLLEAFGITGIGYNLNFTRITAASGGSNGAIVCKGLDGYHRPIVFALLGDTSDLADGALLPEIDEALIARSVNHRLAAEGLAYPTFYTETDPAAIALIGAAAEQARATRRGLWAFDRSEGFTFYGPHTIYEDVVLLPKLFRRLVNFCDAESSLGQLSSFVASKKDPFFVIATGQKLRKLGDLVAVDEQKVSLKFRPHEIQFGEKLPSRDVVP